ncbi:unnamed protein product [Aureobasidium uvarum]|uniref:Uncharacterized protein n=1 Tax=Aureobasidium uvarum TaxID=2773716 RepID=A0A9N8PUZ2_9PEZI|nr:unnamed protein product [Aureobasidium uvarum]
MGNSTSKTTVCSPNNSGSSPDMDIQTPTQTSFHRSPGLHDLSAFNPQHNSHGANNITVGSFAGRGSESGITHPTPARPLIRRYSELLDPDQLDHQQVRSPSGNMLTSSTYNLRDDRPLSVRERQDRIRQQMLQKRKEQEMARGNGRKKDPAKVSVRSASTGKNKRRKGCLGCFGI